MRLLGDEKLVEAVLRDFRASPLSSAEKTLLEFVSRANGQSDKPTRLDIEKVKAAGWSEEAIYDAASVCALFNFYNCWVDSAGVEPNSAHGNQISASTLTRRGYIHDWPTHSTESEP